MRVNSTLEQIWASQKYAPLLLSALRDTRQGSHTKSTLILAGVVGLWQVRDLG